MEYFFTYELELPDSVPGFTLYGPWHIFWLALTASLCLGLAPLYRRASPKRQRAVGLGMTIAMVVIEVCNDIILLYLGRFSWEYLPLHLCGLAIFVCLAHAIHPSDWAGQTLYCLGLPGALAAMLFPDWTRCPPLQFENLHSFSLHTLLILYPVLQLAAGRIRPRLAHCWKPAVFLICTAVPLYFLNHIWGTNFMFLNWPSPGSPLVLMAQVLGNPGYLAGYALLVIAIVLLLYLPPTAYQRYRRKKDQSPM
jgi:hypothetical integral membrane protein (TIGR02206 family)